MPLHQNQNISIITAQPNIGWSMFPGTRVTVPKLLKNSLTLEDKKNNLSKNPVSVAFAAIVAVA